MFRSTPIAALEGFGGHEVSRSAYLLGKIVGLLPVKGGEVISERARVVLDIFWGHETPECVEGINLPWGLSFEESIFSASQS